MAYGARPRRPLELPPRHQELMFARVRCRGVRKQEDLSGLKGSYERNFNLFKQIYAFETYHIQAGIGPITAHGDADRLREYERRLSSARRAGCDVGNITARTVGHWHHTGWYELFYRRWHGDPATTKPVPSRGSNMSLLVGDEPDIDDDQTLDYSDSPQGSNGMTNPPQAQQHTPLLARSRR
ncbi:hypothetical protein GGX14DRAFT_521826 [Mycena pura]|uniref:Uncharacterized protein n=1 Tax=Mycena pura TaxID=153505 RepID=A0AAD6Y904_9AGAR|nr:hypothetical protein GGX14DRAFT_521826 [Mycena pura]